MLASTKHILPVTTIQRRRLLPVAGRVLARKGQKVSASDVVAETQAAPEHVLLDLCRGLGLPLDQVDRHVQRRPGDEVDEGDVVAGPVGMGRRVVRAPRAGKVVLVGDGQMLLELMSQPYELRAGFSGIIADLFPDYGVVIETTGALVQGVWGNGQADFGLLTVVTRSVDDELTAERLDVSMRGTVVLAGYCEDPEALVTAEEIPLRGLILSSLSSALLPAASRLSLPLIILEGFGQLPMSSPAFKLLTTSERREVSVLAEPWDRFAETRPEVIIPLPLMGERGTAPDVETFKTGQQVRVLRAPYQGMVGSLAAMMPGLVALPSGVRAEVAQVQLENGETVVLPLVNLEVLE